MEPTLEREPPSAVTELLVRWREGDREALEALMPLVYDELRRLARHYLRQERNDHTLQSTALVHEAYLRLAGQNPPQWQNRAHFFGIAAHVMRQILVEYARGRSASKRGGGAFRLTLDEAGYALRRALATGNRLGPESLPFLLEEKRLLINRQRVEKSQSPGGRFQIACRWSGRMQTAIVSKG